MKSGIRHYVVWNLKEVEVFRSLHSYILLPSIIVTQLNNRSTKIGTWVNTRPCLRGHNSYYSQTEIKFHRDLNSGLLDLEYNVLTTRPWNLKYLQDLCVINL